MPTLPPINFDPATRAAQYIEVVVTANAVDPDTGANPGSVDTVTALAFTYLQGAAQGSPPTPAVATITQIALAPDGARILRVAPGAVPPGTPIAPGQTGYPFQIRISAAGRTGTLTVAGVTPPILDVSGVAWNGVGPQATPPV